MRFRCGSLAEGEGEGSGREVPVTKKTRDFKKNLKGRNPLIERDILELVKRLTTGRSIQIGEGRGKETARDSKPLKPGKNKGNATEQAHKDASLVFSWGKGGVSVVGDEPLNALSGC